MLALCLSGALAAPVSKAHSAQAAERFLVTETLSAEPSDFASEYDPDMDVAAQKKQLKALRKENRIAAEKVAKVSGDGKTAASMLQRHPHWDEEDEEEELSPRMAERKADHERQAEAHKAEHERQMLAKKEMHEKRKVSCTLHLPRSPRSPHRNHPQLFGQAEKEKQKAAMEKAEKKEAARRKKEEDERKAQEKTRKAQEKEEEGKWVPDAAMNNGKYHPKDEEWKKERDAAAKEEKKEEAPSDHDSASLARFLAGLPGGATGPAARMARRTAERQKMKDQRVAEREKMRAQRQELKASDKERRAAEKTGITVQPSPEPETSAKETSTKETSGTETSAEWYAKATKKLKSSKAMAENGVATVKHTAKEHSDLWKSKHGHAKEHSDLWKSKHASEGVKDEVAKVAKNDEKKVHGGTAWPTKQEEEKGLEGVNPLDAFDFNKAGHSGKKKSKSPSR